MIWKNLVLDFIKENKKNFFFYVVIVLILYPTESLLLPKIYSRLFEKVETSKITNLTENIFKNLHSLSSSGLMWSIIIIWCLVILIYNIKDLLEAKIIPEHISYMRKKIFSKLIEKYSTNFSELKIGKQITRMLEISRSLVDVIIVSLNDLIPLAITLISIMIYFLYTNRKIGITMLVGIIVSIICIIIIGNKALQKSILREDSYLEMSEKLSDSLGNLINIYLNNESRNEKQKNQQINFKQRNHFLEQHFLTTKLQSLITIISVVTFISVIIITYNSLRNNEIKKSYFVGVFIILIYYISNLLRFSNNIPYFIHKMGSVINGEKFIEYILIKEDKSNLKNVINGGRIVFKDISFKYPKKNKYILKGLDLQINSNEKICLVGPSGSGKSTLVKLLLRMNNYENGNIYIDNVNIKKIDVTYLREQIIYVNQKTSLFDTTVLENILYGNKHISKQKVIEVLNKYKLNMIYKGLKNGLVNKTGVNGNNLSLGMQKITIILRGIFKKGKVKIFDEPLAGLDTETRKKVIEMIDNECKNNTVIIITHDKEILPYCTKIIDMKKLKNL